MKVLLGTEGLDASFQGSFLETAPCVKCGKPARIAFVAHETDEPRQAAEPHIPGVPNPYVCRLHKNDCEHGEFWLHDAACFAVYLCPDVHCGTATTLWNQA